MPSQKIVNEKEMGSQQKRQPAQTRTLSQPQCFENLSSCKAESTKNNQFQLLCMFGKGIPSLTAIIERQDVEWFRGIVENLNLF